MCLFVLLSVLCTLSLAQTVGSDQYVTITTKLDRDRVRPGDSFRGALIVTIAEGWHINSSSPTLDYLVPTSFTVRPREGYIVSDITYPRGDTATLEFAEQPLSLYKGTIVIFFTLSTSTRIHPGIDTIRGSLEVQACNNSVCAAPATIDIVIPFLMTNSSEVYTQQHDSLFLNYNQNSKETVSIVDRLEREGFLIALLSIFFVGLALNLTPCVYPMLSVTVSLFGGTTEKRVGVVFVKALVYVLGMATMYSVLGVSAALGGGLFGSWLQSPYILAGIAVLMFALALSSFGLYQIRVPYWLANKLGGAMGTGYIGLFSSGVVVGLFAAPCVGPPVIALLTFVTLKGDVVFGFLVFFVLALGLGFPYLVLGTFSGLLRKIPRSGQWLVWVEHIFGVILFGVGLFYLFLAIAPRYSIYVVPFVLIAGGIYGGFLESRVSSSVLLKRVQWAFGVLAIAGGVWSIASFSQPSIQWESYSEDALLKAQQQNIPIIIDFYADWCIPCKELERRTWTNPEVIKATSAWKRLKVDLTHFDSPESEMLRKQYHVAGVPTVLLLIPSSHGWKEHRIVGFIPPQEFLFTLDQMTNQKN
ncbi:MAG: thioredoxin family protein [Bacteroidetes bacterium]|nr:thioredoxin family protein [Bacteroidota bacterium]